MDKIDLLIPDMQIKCRKVIELCNSKNLEILVYCTYRSLEEQAIIFRQGRSYAEIKYKMDSLRKSGFGFLSDVIENVGPQSGNKIITYAGPGESWHNFKEAFDAVPLLGGKALWNDNQKYDIYGSCVIKVGLNWGGSWKRFKDRPHAQLRFGKNPLRVYSPVDIEELLNKMK